MWENITKRKISKEALHGWTEAEKAGRTVDLNGIAEKDTGDADFVVGGFRVHTRFQGQRGHH